MSASGQADRPRAADRPAERPAHDVDDLVHVLVRLALLGRRPDTAADVVLEDAGSTASRRRPGARRSAGGCRRSTPRARSSGRSRGPGPPSATGGARAGPCPSNSCGGSGSGRAGPRRDAPRSDSSVVGILRRSSGSWRRRWCAHDTPWGYGWPRAVASGAPRLDLPPMDPSGRPRSIPDGATCTACGAPVPTGRIRILATRDDLAFVELVCDDCGSAALGMLLATAGHDAGHVARRRHRRSCHRVASRRSPVAAGRSTRPTWRPCGWTSPPGRATWSAGSTPSDGPGVGRRRTGERALRACQRGRDVADPGLLRGALGVRAGHVPDPVEPRWRRHRELLAGLLPAGSRPLPRDDDAPPEAGPAQEPQAPPAARAVPGPQRQAVLRAGLPGADAQVRQARPRRRPVRDVGPGRVPVRRARAGTRCRRRAARRRPSWCPRSPALRPRPVRRPRRRRAPAAGPTRNGTPA